MSEVVIPVPDEWKKRAFVNAKKYQQWYADSIADPDGFWSQQGQELRWIKPFENVRDVSFDARDLHIRWFYDGTLNVSANCIDRHLAKRADQTAIIWEGDDPSKSKNITYRELHAQVCRMANALKELEMKAQ